MSFYTLVYSALRLTVVVLLLSLAEQCFAQEPQDNSIPCSQTDSEMWLVVNDGVMGGLSEGNINVSEQGVRFYGNLSLENNGGFSRFRSDFSLASLSPKSSDTLFIRYKTDHHDYRLTVETQRINSYRYFGTDLPSTQGEWKTVGIARDELLLSVMGRRIGAPLESWSQMAAIGVILADKREGAFSMEVQDITWKN